MVVHRILVTGKVRQRLRVSSSTRSSHGSFLHVSAPSFVSFTHAPHPFFRPNTRPFLQTNSSYEHLPPALSDPTGIVFRVTHLIGSEQAVVCRAAPGQCAGFSRNDLRCANTDFVRNPGAKSMLDSAPCGVGAKWRVLRQRALSACLGRSGGD
jgi:hypothetical protein